MKIHEWDPAKNIKLEKERNISFEEIVFYIEKGAVLYEADHARMD